jgi:16S rRNA processing protein RimM
MAADGGGGAGPGHLVVGHVAKAHGTRGEVFVWPLTDSPDAVFAPGRELLLGDEDAALDEDAAPVTVESARAFKRGLLVKFANTASREAAEVFARRYLLVPSSAVPPLGEDEVFYHELLGMSVADTSGTVLGTVREVYETEPHHLLEVAGTGGRSHLVPFARRIVREIDTTGRRLIIDPPEGLLDL